MATNGSTGALLLLALALAVLPGCKRLQTGPNRIVLVTIDTLRADRVGVYGDPRAHTPVLDDLARVGVRFDQAISQVPLTLPSHTSIMSGLEPPAHGVRHNSVFSVSPEIPLLAEHLSDAGYATAAFIAAFVLDSQYGLDRGFDLYDDKMGDRRAARGPFSFAERPGNAVVDAALEWLADAPERFFLWVHLYDPHAEYQPPPRYARLAGSAYGGEIAFADAQVGRLLADITRRWGPQGTLVVVTSDHGESLGEHQEPSHSYTIYDATQHVPLILAGSGVPAGKVSTTPVRLIDVAPTLLDLAGATPLPDIQGRSLRPLFLTDGEDEPERVAYVETLATQFEMGWSPLLGLRTARYKYIRAPQPELYDLEADPHELRNLARAQPERVATLDGALETHLTHARPLETTLELHEDDRARLESLGYLVPTAGALASGELGVVGGRNPADYMHEAAALHEATALLTDGWPDRALELMKPIRSGGSRAVRIIATAALQSGRADEAIPALETLRESGQAGPPDLTFLGAAYLATNRIEDARSAFQAGLDLDANASGPKIGLAALAEREGDIATAERLLREAETHGTHPAEARAKRAALLLRQGRTEEADALLPTVEKWATDDPHTAASLAAAELQAGRKRRAIQFLRRSLRKNPSHRLLLTDYATVLESVGRVDEALEIWRRAYALAPDDARSKNDLAWGLAVSGEELDRALTLAGEALDEMGDDPGVLDTVATVHLARSEPHQALRVADQTLPAASPPLRAHLLYVRAAALAQLGRNDEAAASLRELRASPVELQPPWADRAAALERRLGIAPAAG